MNKIERGVFSRIINARTVLLRLAFVLMMVALGASIWKKDHTFVLLVVICSIALIALFVVID